MSQIIVECPGCLSKLRLRESEHDVQLDCPRCNERILVEGTGTGRASGPPTSGATGPTRQSPPRRSAADVSRPSSRSQRPGAASASGSGSPQGRAESRGSAAAGRRRPSGRPGAAKDDFDEFDATYETEAARPPSRRARRSLANESRTSQSSGVLIGLAIGAAVVGLAGAGWYFLSGPESGEAVVENEGASSLGGTPVAGEASSGYSGSGTTPAEVTPNTFAAGNMPSVVPPGQNTAPKPLPFGSSPGAQGRSSGADVASAPDARPAAINPPPQSTMPGGFQTPPAAVAPGAVAPGGGATVASAIDGRRLRYQWTDGADHLYVVNITAGEGDGTYRVNGTCNYRVGGNSATPEEESSGTGFAMTADGYIGTCAHVVDGARQIEVVINNQTLAASVVAVNTKADVAILKVNATGLIPVQFQDSDTVQLAESVRVIGFPLSDVLGTDVKITSGTVAGIVMDPQRGKRIQVDAPINPGNSGGPVVNDAGEVVGVASAKLAGSSVTAVGFAAPVNELRNLMIAQRVPVTMATRGIALSGPAVFQKVRPSVCYIKVRGSSGGAAATIRYSGSFTETKSINPGNLRFGAFPMMPSHTSDQGTMRVNAMGEILDYSGEEHLPFVLGYMGMFFIERLDPYSETQWSYEENSTLQRIKRSGRGPGGLGGPGGRGFMPPRMPMGPRGFGGSPFGGGGPFGQGQPDEVVDTIPAVERVSYRTGQELNGKLSLQKTYEFITTRNPQQPYMKIRGTGTVVFDLKLGMPQSLEYNATLESNDEDGHSSFPLKVSYTLRDPEEVKREREQAMQRSKEAAEQRKQQATVPDNQLVESLLDQIRNAEGDSRASQPLSKLAEIAVVDDLRSKVLIVTRKHMKNSNGFVSKSAAEAFAHWATEKEFDELIEIIKNKDGMMYTAHKKVVATMATFDDPRVYPILIEAMHHSFVRTDARNAMISIGSNVEDTVLEQFEQITDSSVKRELLEVLQKIGTGKCERFLEKIATGPDFSLRHNAQRALDAIRAR